MAGKGLCCRNRKSLYSLLVGLDTWRSSFKGNVCVDKHNRIVSIMRLHNLIDGYAAMLDVATDGSKVRPVPNAAHVTAADDAPCRSDSGRWFIL